MKLRIEQIKPEHVLSVYNGKAGACCCGCSGKHFYNPAYIELGGKERGYKVDTDECSLSTVTRTIRKVQANLATATVDNSDAFGSHVCVTTDGAGPGRWNMIYLKRGIKVRKGEVK